MVYQSPMISIPKKATEEVDWATPIRTVIAQSYGENPDNYATECASLQRCRQDAVRGAGSDLTARDLLYKYFGQLELLELRFSEIRVNFPWHDAFTNKLITQTSIAYEKACILFQIAVTHSAIAAAQNRSELEGLKRAFYYSRTCAGMLTYVNENFLHAPSTDLSREVVKYQINIILAQATEIFFDKCTEEKKGNTLVAKIAAQVAFMYTSLTEEVKEFIGKGIFDRNWVTLIQIKSKHFQSIAQYYRALADNAASKYGEAVARYLLAESCAKEASRLSASFAASFITTMSPNLPADAGTSINERVKAHLALCTDRKTEAQLENSMIYNATVPVADALPTLEKMPVATIVPIQEVFGSQEVQKVIGPDLFVRLVPLSVHESASVYSEEKAKLVRGEVEKAEGAESEVRSTLDSMGVREGLTRFKAMAEGEINEELPVEVRRWKEDIAVMEEREPVEALVVQLNRAKERVRQELNAVTKELEAESRECEAMRLKYEHLWTQEPSAAPTKSLRQDLKAHYGALDAAAPSDQQVDSIWRAVQGDITLLLSDEIDDIFRASTEQPGNNAESLLDLDVGTDSDEEREKIRAFVNETEERLTRLQKISNERNEVLKDLKEKIQVDDVSHLLLLNRRNTTVEPKLFAAELEKFRPYQQRLAATVHHQQVALHELAALWKSLKDIAGKGAGAKKWDEREKRKKDTVRRFSRARDGYTEARDGIAKGLQFYNELAELSGTLHRNATSWIAKRTTERDALASQAEIQKRLTATPASPPPLADRPPMPRPLPHPSAPSVTSSFASMSLGSSQTTSPFLSHPPHRPSQPLSYGASYQSSGAPSSHFSSVLPPPPPPPPAPAPAPPPQPPSRQPSYPPPASDPYASLSLFDPSSQFSSASPAASPPPPPPPPSQPSWQQPAYPYQPTRSLPPPPPPPGPYGGGSAPIPAQYNYMSSGAQQPQQQRAFQQQQYHGGFPPPPSQPPYGQRYPPYG